LESTPLSPEEIAEIEANAPSQWEVTSRLLGINPLTYLGLGLAAILIVGNKVRRG